MMSLKGIPAFYIHSLLATHNYNEGVEETGRSRTINRRKWDIEELAHSLEADKDRKYVLDELKKRIGIRKSLKIFHPDNPQQIIDGGSEFFIVKRYDDDGNELVALANLTNREISMKWTKPYKGNGSASDMISGRDVQPGKPIKFQPYQVIWLAEKRS
jgi:sucrose phosphorylase